MNELFWPSQTSEASGGSLVGTMSADRASGPQMPATYEQVLPVQSQEPQATPDVAGLSRVQAQGLAQDGQQATFFNKLSFNQKTGEVNVSLDQSALAEVMGQLTDLKQMKAAAMARVAQLKQQEASGSPLIDALSTFAGNMAANDPKMPGWIRALGQTSLQMGPQGIRAKREAEEGKVLGLTKGIADLGMEAARFDQAVSSAAQTNMLKAAEMSRKMMESAQPDVKEFAKLMGRVSTETRQLRQFDPDTFALEAKALGATDEQVSAATDKFLSLAAMAQRKHDLERAAEESKANRDEANRLNRQAISIGAAMDRVLTSKDVAAVGAAQRLDAKEESFLSAARAYDEYLNAAISTVDKYREFMGPVAGRITRLNPYRKQAEEAMQKINTNLQRFMQSNGESIARGSDRDMKLFERAAADITSDPDAALIILKNQREALQGKLRGVIEVNPYADWKGRYGYVLPKWGHPIRDEVLSRVASGPGMALPSGGRTGGEAQPTLPADFVDFLKSLPSGKGGKFTDGKTYVLRDGVPVEVR